MSEPNRFVLRPAHGGALPASARCDRLDWQSVNAPSSTHLVLIPSFNPGRKVYDTLASAREQWAPVWVVVDGSTDGTRGSSTGRR